MRVNKPIACDISTKSPEYGYYTDDCGVMQFGVVGEIDDLEMIQRHKDSCDFTILKEYLLANNVEPVGVYGVRPLQFSDINEASAFVKLCNEQLKNIEKEVNKNTVDEVLEVPGDNSEINNSVTTDGDEV